MITLMEGSLFDVYSDIRVNTVNCVGVMGAGVAREFKQRYPAMFAEYAKRCRRQEVKPGCPFVWTSGGTTIINFPTKNHWRRPSQYDYIENGLVWLSAYLSQNPDASIAVPPLGCGNGGLHWPTVLTMITDTLDGLDNEILVFQPRYGSPIKEPVVRRVLKGKTQWRT